MMGCLSFVVVADHHPMEYSGQTFPALIQRWESVAICHGVDALSMLAINRCCSNGNNTAVDFPSFCRDTLIFTVSESCAAVVSSSLFGAAASTAPDNELINGIDDSGENNSPSSSAILLCFFFPLSGGGGREGRKPNALGVDHYHW